MNRTISVIFLICFSFATASTTVYAAAKNPFFIAQKHMKSGEFSKAIPVLKRYNLARPGSPETNYMLGVCYLNTQQLSHAHRAFVHALKLDKNYSKAIGDTYFRVGFKELQKGNIRKSRILLQKATRYDNSLHEKIARDAFEEGKRIFNRGEYEKADERLSVANTFDNGYGGEICSMYFQLGNSADSSKCLYFYSVARWYCSEHNEEIGLRLLQIAQSSANKEWQEKFKGEAAKYIGTEAVLSALPVPSWKSIYTAAYTGKGYDDKNSPEYHIRAIQWGKDALTGDKVIVEADGPFRLWDSGWQDWDSRCVMPPSIRPSGEHLYLEGPKDKKILVQIQRYE